MDFGLDDVDDNNNGVVLDTSTLYDLVDECADGDVDDNNNEVVMDTSTMM